MYNNNSWNIIPLFGFDIWNNEICDRCPTITQFLKSIPNLRTVLFSKLNAKSRIRKHQGWGKLANYVLRCHYPLIMDDNSVKKCYMVVDNIKKEHQLGEWLIFDD